MRDSDIKHATERAQHVALALLISLSVGACAKNDIQSLILRESIEQGSFTRSEIPRFRMSQQDLLEASDVPRDFAGHELTALDKSLLEAARMGNTEAMRQHIKAGARVNAVDQWGNTPLGYAAASGDLVRAQLLLKERAEVEGRGGTLTPLAWAALRGHIHMVTLLIKQGARLDAQGFNGVSPLVLAVRLNHLNVAETLLKAGARVDVKERDGKSLLMVAIVNDQVAMADLLLSYKADPNALSADGSSALSLARELKREGIAQRLEQAGAREQVNTALGNRDDSM